MRRGKRNLVSYSVFVFREKPTITRSILSSANGALCGASRAPHFGLLASEGRDLYFRAKEKRKEHSEGGEINGGISRSNRERASRRGKASMVLCSWCLFRDSRLAAFQSPSYLDLVDDHRQVCELDDGLGDRERQRAQARPEAADENESSDHVSFRGGLGWGGGV